MPLNVAVTLQPCCSRYPPAIVGSGPRWATLTACASRPTTSPCSPTPRRSRSRPQRPDGPPHRTIIWIVVDGDDAFVRSVNGARARWYREATANPAVDDPRRRPGAAGARDRRHRPRLVARVNDALVRKYTGISGLPEMLVPDIFDTTLRLEPA